jgi:hypothetical protein
MKLLKLGPPEFINDTEIDVHAPYAISEAGANMAIPMYNATYKEGILFIAICPRAVDIAGFATIFGFFHQSPQLEPHKIEE